ncbi:virulence RhuM family protein [Phascolarctobacterium faecium]|uniref:virulence RhuM family protein n=1 Tax=Phascolarctobacterium faecium TaxID=33025 RepID=UPI002058F9EB|nr:MAG TPA: virulence protein RhuM family [Caudoviricetes sp.]
MYQTEDGQTRIEVHMENETVWLSQAQMADLFQKNISTISRHISNIFDEGELDEKSNLHFTQIANSDKPVAFYSLDVIISVGYRVKSLRGTQFRIWANKILKEYIIKGFSMNDEFLKNSGGGQYWKELLDRIRDIRSSEKVFYRQILDIYATSIDYNPESDYSKAFFSTVQNKMHWAAHKHTAAEIVMLRADHTKPLMGMTNFKGSKIKSSDVDIAKNYLTEQELGILNRLVSMYLDFAELQAEQRIPMTMKDWIAKLDDFIKISNREVLTSKGTVKSIAAKEKALEEYKKYKKLNNDNHLNHIEKDYVKFLSKKAKELK